jgi:hypothetical protein
MKHLYRGFSAAIFAQVPYSIITISTFEMLDKSVFSANEETRFNKNDEFPFVIKFLIRFGASTLAIAAAQTVLYPFDTIKRCLQLNGSKGHKSLYNKGVIDCAKQLGLRGCYAGFGLNLVKTLPLSAINLIIFNCLRHMSEPK